MIVPSVGRGVGLHPADPFEAARSGIAIAAGPLGISFACTAAALDEAARAMELLAGLGAFG